MVKTESLFLAQEVSLALNMLEKLLVGEKLSTEAKLLVAEDVLQHVVSRFRRQCFLVSRDNIVFVRLKRFKVNLCQLLLSKVHFSPRGTALFVLEVLDGILLFVGWLS